MSGTGVDCSSLGAVSVFPLSLGSSLGLLPKSAGMSIGNMQKISKQKVNQEQKWRPVYIES